MSDWFEGHCQVCFHPEHPDGNCSSMDNPPDSGHEVHPCGCPENVTRAQRDAKEVAHG